MGKKKGGKGIKMDLNPNPFTSPSHDNRNHFHFGDVSKEQKGMVDEEGILDSKLSSLGLIRKKIPKDGACLFRAAADQLMSTQTFHYQVRQRCVETIFMNREFYLPFISVSNNLTGQSVGFEDYIECMRKVDTWGGQIECHAISTFYNACLIIHNINSSIPTIINPPSQEESASFITSRSKFYPSKTPEVHLCYYNNHYDTVVSDQYHQREILCQQIVYSIINKIFSEDEDYLFKTVDRHKKKQDKIAIIEEEREEEEPEKEWKNVGWECWIREGRDQERKDQEIAQNINQDRPSDQAWSSPYQRKKGANQNQNITPIKSNSKPNSTQSTPKVEEVVVKPPPPSFSSENEFFPTLISTTPKKVQPPESPNNPKWGTKNWGQILTQTPKSKEPTTKDWYGKRNRPVRRVKLFNPNGKHDSPVQYIKEDFLQLNLSLEESTSHQFGFFPHQIKELKDESTKEDHTENVENKSIQQEVGNHLYPPSNLNYVHPKGPYMVPHYYHQHPMMVHYPSPANSMIYPHQTLYPPYYFPNMHFGTPIPNSNHHLDHLHPPPNYPE
eukprot:TRINITY_DN3894_c0_g1_i2.p1 TRINITY_DN3894_c0_g1~~TRINITY_DN3894_c0_g1_i2.p1  ORF type:complete len:556 (-),score=189.29 TRINITY_DN3894_c0_g1_i2:179-1846(-)